MKSVDIFAVAVVVLARFGPSITQYRPILRAPVVSILILFDIQCAFKVLQRVYINSDAP